MQLSHAVSACNLDQTLMMLDGALRVSQAFSVPAAMPTCACPCLPMLINSSNTCLVECRLDNCSCSLCSIHRHLLEVKKILLSHCDRVCCTRAVQSAWAIQRGSLEPADEWQGNGRAGSKHWLAEGRWAPYLTLLRCLPDQHAAGELDKHGKDQFALQLLICTTCELAKVVDPVAVQQAVRYQP